MLTVALRALLFYLILMALMRFMGKRQIGELQLSEFVTTILLSELAVLPVSDTRIPLLYGLFPLLLIASVEVVIAILCQKSQKFRTFINGNPITLYENGAFNRKSLIMTRLSREDVAAQVRINGYSDMTEVSKVILEQTGKMSVLPKGPSTPNQSGG